MSRADKLRAALEAALIEGPEDLATHLTYADLLIEQLGDFDLGVLTTPEFNYGVPLLIILLAAFGVIWSPDRRARRDRVKAG